MKVSYQPPPLGTLPSVKDLIPFSGIADDSSGTCAARERRTEEVEKGATPVAEPNPTPRPIFSS